LCWPFRREMYEKATRMTTNRRKSSRTTMGFGSSGCLSILGYGEFRRGSPQPVELVKIPDAVPEDQRADGGGFFLLCQPRALDHRIRCGYGRSSSPAPRYRPCSAMYFSTSGGTRPRMHLLLRTFSRMELEEISRAGRAGQYNFRPPGRR